MGQRKRKVPLDTKVGAVDDAQREAYLSEISHLRSRLLATFDALDVLQTQHTEELQAKDAECDKFRRRAVVYEKIWREAEEEQQDMEAAVEDLVFKVEKCNDYSQWPYSRLRISTYAGPSSLSPPLLPPPSSAYPHPYAASLVTALQRNLQTEKAAHAETRHRLTLHISSLEAQLAFREAELEACGTRIGGRCRNCFSMSDANVHYQSMDKPSGPPNGNHNTPDAVLRVLDAARAKSRSLEQDIQDITAKLENSRIDVGISSKSKAVQTDQEGDGGHEDLFRFIAAKLRRSQVDGMQDAPQPTTAVPGLVPGDEDIDEDATLRPPTAPITTPPPPPPPIATTNTTPSHTHKASTYQNKDKVADDADPGGGPNLVNQFEKEVEALGQGVDALREESEALMRYTRIQRIWQIHQEIRGIGDIDDVRRVGTYASRDVEDVPDVLQTQWQSLDLLDPDEDYGEISMELATPLNPTVTLPPVPPLPSPLLTLTPPPPSLRATLIPIPTPPLSTSLSTPPPPPFTISTPPQIPTPIPIPVSTPSPSTSPTPGPSSPLPPSTSLRRLPTQTPLTSVFRSRSPSSSIERSPNHSTELDDLRLPALSALPPLPRDCDHDYRDEGRDYGDPDEGNDRRGRGTSPSRSSRSSSPLRLSPYLTSTDTAILYNNGGWGETLKGSPSPPPSTSPLLSPSPSLELSPTSSRRVTTPASPATAATIMMEHEVEPAHDVDDEEEADQYISIPIPTSTFTSSATMTSAEYHLHRIETQLRETREALEADEVERMALQSVLDGLVREVVIGVFEGAERRG